MKSIFCCILLVFLLRSINTKSTLPNKSDSDELVLVHAVFRHGNRTPEGETYTGNPYGDESFYLPFGFDQLTNEGKRTEYKIGQALRERYDSFIGNEYYFNLLDVRSDSVDRTKMSALLVTASLFPPSEDLIWNSSLNWQPIPYNYYENDKVISGYKICTNYDTKYKKVLKTDEIVEKLTVYQDMFSYLSNHTLANISKPKKAAKLYTELLTQKAYGYPLEDWTSKYMAQMKQITLDNYGFMTYTKKLKKIISGYMLQKVIEDTKTKISNNTSTKMYLYSVHEKNIAALLLTIGIFDNEVPSFGSYVLIEVRRIDGIYGLKFYYQNYQEESPILMTVPGCSEFCSLNDFEAIIGDYIPDDNDCDLA